MCSVTTAPDELFLESRPVHKPIAPGQVLLVVDEKKRPGVLAGEPRGFLGHLLHDKAKAGIVSTRLEPLGAMAGFYCTSTVTFRLVASPTNHFWT